MADDHIRWGLIALAIFSSSPAAAQSPAAAGQKPMVVAGREWAAQPSDQEIVSAFPKGAAKRSVGLVALSCKVAAGGILEDCSVNFESPSGQGFGAAGLTLASRFRMAPDRAPAGTVIQIPMRIGLKPAVAPAKPSGETRYYPPKALAKELSGEAMLRCWVLDSGALSDCRILSESPEGYGFGDAALVLAEFFNMKKGRDGVTASAGSIVNVPVKFKLN